MLGLYIAEEVTRDADRMTGLPKAFSRFMPMGSDGRPVTRMKQTHPWNYDEFVKWEVKGVEAKSGAYSDRLYQQDPTKYKALCRKHFGNEGQYWDQRSPEKIEAFLQDYLDCFENVRLTRICEGCNQSSGYPYWRFDYTYTRQKPTEKPRKTRKTQDPQN
jgi:hypothetical protein